MKRLFHKKSKGSSKEILSSPISPSTPTGESPSTRHSMYLSVNSFSSEQHDGETSFSSASHLANVKSSLYQDAAKSPTTPSAENGGAETTDFPSLQDAALSNASVAPIPGKDAKFTDRVVAFTKQMNEEFVALERHMRNEDVPPVPPQNPKSPAPKKKAQKKLPKKGQLAPVKPKKSPINPLLLTNEALYKLHPDHYEYSARKPLMPPLSLTAQDSIDWFREYHRVQFDERKEGSHAGSTTGPSAASQKVINDLFSAHVVQPKWRISLLYVESVEEDRNNPGEWLFTCFSDEQRHKDGADMLSPSAASAPSTAQITTGKDPVARVVRRYKCDDPQKTTIWVETFRAVLQSFWQRKWEQSLAQAVEGVSQRRFSVVRASATLKALRSASAPEFYQHHAWVHKINRKGQEQFRCLLLSNRCMYLVNALPGDSLETLPTVRWRLEIGTALSALVMYDEDPTVVGILMDKNAARKQSKKAHAAYDFRCASEQVRNTHMMEISRLYYICSGGKSLNIKRETEGKPTGSSK